MKTLCVYFTRTNLTEKIAAEISRQLDAELLKITDGKDRSGVLGYITAAVLGLKKSFPKLKPYKTEYPLCEYDRIIIAAPVWCEDICPIARAFAFENRQNLKGDIYLVITHMSNISYEKKISAFETLINKKVKSFLSLKTKKHDYSIELQKFVCDIRD